jgi:hypothetical protein
MPIQYLVPIQTNSGIRSAKCTCRIGESRVFFQGSGVAKFCSQIPYFSVYSRKSCRKNSDLTATTQGARKPWRKKTPVEVLRDQINRLHDDVLAKEEELKQAKRQLQKLEEPKKVLETTQLFIYGVFTRVGSFLVVDHAFCHYAESETMPSRDSETLWKQLESFG